MFQYPWRSMRGPWAELSRLQQEMNRIFARHGSPVDTTTTAYPAINLWHDGECLFVEAELPGIKLDDLDIVVTAGNQLNIRGRRPPASSDDVMWHRQERGHGEFSRIVQLPIEVDADHVQATLKDGVLSLRLPKHAEAKPRKIDVKTA